MTEHALLDLAILGDGDAFVGSFISQYSRSAFALQCAKRRAVTPFASVDVRVFLRRLIPQVPWGTIDQMAKVVNACGDLGPLEMVRRMEGEGWDADAVGRKCRRA